VNASGNVSLGNQMISAGLPLASLELQAGLTYSVQDSSGINRIVSRDNSLLPTHPAA
jgi:hypothetical protein